MEYAITERPQTINEFVGNATVKSQFTKFFEENTLPHKLLFTGRSGLGKSTLCQIVKNYLGVDDAFNLQIIDCGAQKDIATARETVKLMARCALGGDSQNMLFILEEVHRLPKPVQETYLASLESLKDNQYVVASTDQPDLLLETFRSRFMEVALKPLSSDDMYNDLLMPIVKRDSIKVRVSTLKEICTMSMGNNRTALSLLTAISSLDPSEHENALSSMTEAENKSSIYTGVSILLGNTSGIFPYFIRVRDSFVHSDKEPEAIRQCVLLRCAYVLKNEKDMVMLERASVLSNYFKDITCYGEIGWATLLGAVYNFLSKFS